MAKRKRLTPAQPGFLGAPFDTQAENPRALPAGPPAPTLGAAPIAQVAGDSAARAALDEVAGVLQDARAEGRLIEALPLEVIDQAYLVRDRLVQDEEEMIALTDSMRNRGQQTPIEVIALPAVDGTVRYGLISGWRRLTALTRLNRQAESVQDKDRFATIKALVIAPASAQEAYVAMVEENEIRVNLSLYERARIALSAMHQEIYPTSRAALQGLFATTTRSKRSKIGSFMGVVEALDSKLRHPTAIPEKLGLGLAREIERDWKFKEKVGIRLLSDPPKTAEDELRILAGALAEARNPPPPLPPSDPVAPSASPPVPSSDGSGTRPRIRSIPPEQTKNERVFKPGSRGVLIGFTKDQNRIELTGDGVDEALYEAVQDWLKSR